MTAVFLDTNVPIYAASGEGPVREACLGVLRAVAGRRLDACTDAETLQELLHRYLALRRTREGFALFDDFAALLEGRVLPVEAKDCRAARALAERYPWSSARDLIHVAVCVSAGVRRVVTSDRDFDRFTEVERVDPVRLAASLT